jgi:SAM-dependent methyltransferase
MYELEDHHWWFRGRRAVLWALIRRAGVRPSRRVLDAGCGTGRNLQDYRVLGPVRGIDPSPSAVEFCHLRGLREVTQAGLESMPFEGDSFDLIFATDVLEHVDDDLAGMRELRRVAARNALLVITVPAYMWLWGNHDEAFHHKRRYSRRVLAGRAATSGWEPVLSTYFNLALLAPIAVTRALRRSSADGRRSELELTPPALDSALALPMRLEAALVGRGATLPAGVSIGMACRAR